MERQDYLKKQIDQLGRLLGKLLSDLLRLKGQGQINEGIAITTQTLKSELDLDLQILLEMPNEDFIHTLKSQKEFDNENLDKLATLLLALADNGQDEKTNLLYEKCLAIYEYLEKSDNTYSFDRQLKIKRIENILLNLL